MNRTILMIFAVSLMGGTAAFAQPDPQGQGTQTPPECGKPDQPACPTEEEKKKGKGKKPDAQKDQPAGAPGQPPADPATPPAGGPQGKKQGGQQDQPAAAPDAQKDKPTGPQTQPPTDQATPPAGGPQNQRRGGQQDQQPPAAGTQQDQTTQGRDGRRRDGQGPFGPGGQAGPQGQFGPPPGGARWNRGQYVPQEYRRDQYFIIDWQRNNLPPPPRGYRWMCYERGDCFLVQMYTGYVSRSYRRDDRYNFWRRRYARMYSYNDDLYYRECRGRSDPAGILVGGLIGGLVGRSIGDERAGPTFAGIIIGGSLGAAFTRDLDCDDRSYAYHSYYNAFNSGRVGRDYRWRNSRTNHRGVFVVRGYYYDDDGFRCARYRHTVWFDDRRRRMDGYACRQPDGAWLFIR